MGIALSEMGGLSGTGCDFGAWRPWTYSRHTHLPKMDCPRKAAGGHGMGWDLFARSISRSPIVVRRVRLDERMFLLSYDCNCKKIYTCTSEQGVYNTVSSVVRGINALAKCSEPIKHIKQWGISIYSVIALSCLLLQHIQGCMSAKLKIFCVGLRVPSHTILGQISTCLHVTKCKIALLSSYTEKPTSY